MANGFWERLERPFVCSAPMADVTDAPFRRLLAEYGKPDVIWNEFVSADGLSSGEGRKKLIKILHFKDEERPIVAQFFGSKPENFKVCAELAVELGYDGIDINMGCPDKSVNKQRAGADLINNPKLAQDIIRTVKKYAPNLPISVKTRAGYNKVELEAWLPYLLETDPALITVHARTKKELSLVPARWELVRRAKEIALAYGSKTLIMGNGDVKSAYHALQLAEETGADGVMIGRALIGRPWLLRNLEYIRKLYSKDEKEDAKKLSDLNLLRTPAFTLAILKKHANYFDEFLSGERGFHRVRKHLSKYAIGFSGSKELRTALMSAENKSEVCALVDKTVSRLENEKAV
ncbi:MAG: tRNA-dihydrouridine synthase [Candidatus Vogelbacteria bacterium]|nr:tRNA-dihydrouridine synthase [Candidatus Vogelbacteria bacterium]